VKRYFVYILECSDGKLYTGMTNNLERRFNEHQHGFDRNSFTYTRRPVSLVFHGEFNDVYFAMDWERRLKKWSAVKKRALIAGDSKMLSILAECRNCTHFKFGPG
jgi:putative endonuclease